MKRTRHTPEQIVRKLREADAALSAGASIGQVCQRLGVSLLDLVDPSKVIAQCPEFIITPPDRL